ncbi:MAG TPA: serine hydrolase domain-containing protein [Rhizomicrobium sp.]|nr:serine hydrolase domain-containing protein [Rhizomicrobium sp.]
MSSHGFDPDRLKRLHDVISQNYVESGAIPGALTMIWRDGGLAWLGMSGVTDIATKTPMRDDAIFRIYSMTKPITTVALLMLMEDGEIALDDPVSRFIPRFADLRLYAGGLLGNFVTVPCAKPMKVVDLLRHTSGLTYGILNRTSLDAAYRKLKVAEPGMEGGMKGLIETLEKLPLEFVPGETWNYSVGLDVAAYLVELISGVRFSDFVNKRIFMPLGMADTDFVVPARKRDRFTTCYYVQGSQLAVFDDIQNSAYYQPPLLESGGGGLVSTAEDYMRFCRMLLNGGTLGHTRLLSPKTVELMTMNHLPGDSEMTEIMPSSAAFNESGYGGVGFGLSVAVTRNLARTGIPGTVGEYSWGGAAGTYFFNDPKEDMAVVFMSQVLFAPGRVKLRRDLRTLVYSAIAESFA